jgi:hypothetical protein
MPFGDSACYRTRYRNQIKIIPLTSLRLVLSSRIELNDDYTILVRLITLTPAFLVVSFVRIIVSGTLGVRGVLILVGMTDAPV